MRCAGTSGTNYPASRTGGKPLLRRPARLSGASCPAVRLGHLRQEAPRPGRDVVPARLPRRWRTGTCGRRPRDGVVSRRPPGGTGCAIPPSGRTAAGQKARGAGAVFVVPHEAPRNACTEARQRQHGSSRSSAQDLDRLVEALRTRGYTVMGPVARDGALVWDEVSSAADLPAGWTDEQAPGRYRLQPHRRPRALRLDGGAGLAQDVAAPGDGDAAQGAARGRGPAGARRRSAGAAPGLPRPARLRAGGHRAAGPRPARRQGDRPGLPAAAPGRVPGRGAVRPRREAPASAPRWGPARRSTPGTTWS